MMNNRNPTPKEDERNLPKVMVQEQKHGRPPVKRNGKIDPREEVTMLSIRPSELSRERMDERAKTADYESRRKKLQLIVGATLAMVAAAAGTVFVTNRGNTGNRNSIADEKTGASKNIPQPPAVSLPEADIVPPAPEPTVLAATIPTSEPTAEPSVDPSEVAVAPTSPPAHPAARPPGKDSIYDEIENESMYDTLDRKYPTKASKQQPKTKNSGGIIRKAPF